MGTSLEMKPTCLVMGAGAGEGHDSKERDLMDSKEKARVMREASAWGVNLSHPILVPPSTLCHPENL